MNHIEWEHEGDWQPPVERSGDYLLEPHVAPLLAMLARTPSMYTPPRQYTRWERRRMRWSNRWHFARERVALLLAPWLDQGDW